MASACRQMTRYVMARLLLYDNDSHTFIAVIGKFTAVWQSHVYCCMTVTHLLLINNWRVYCWPVVICSVVSSCPERTLLSPVLLWPHPITSCLWPQPVTACLWPPPTRTLTLPSLTSRMWQLWTSSIPVTLLTVRLSLQQLVSVSFNSEQNQRMSVASSSLWRIQVWLKPHWDGPLTAVCGFQFD